VLFAAVLGVPCLNDLRRREPACFDEQAGFGGELFEFEIGIHASIIPQRRVDHPSGPIPLKRKIKQTPDIDHSPA